MFVMLLGRFRDDLREALGMDPGLPAQRGSQRCTFGELHPTGIDAMGGAVAVLLEDRFRACMDDPALVEHLEALEAALNVEKHERANAS